MIKRPIDKGQIEIVIGERYTVKGDSFKYETHIYLQRGNEMHGGIGKTPEESIYNAVAHWRSDVDRKQKESENADICPT